MIFYCGSGPFLVSGDRRSTVNTCGYRHAHDINFGGQRSASKWESLATVCVARSRGALEQPTGSYTKVHRDTISDLLGAMLVTQGSIGKLLYGGSESPQRLSPRRMEEAVHPVSPIQVLDGVFTAIRRAAVNGGPKAQQFVVLLHFLIVLVYIQEPAERNSRGNIRLGATEVLHTTDDRGIDDLDLTGYRSRSARLILCFFKRVVE